jgi:hypothetical protein
LVQFVRNQKAQSTPTLTQKQPTDLPDLRNLAVLPNTLVEWNIYPKPTCNPHSSGLYCESTWHKSRG